MTYCVGDVFHGLGFFFCLPGPRFLGGRPGPLFFGGRGRPGRRLFFAGRPGPLLFRGRPGPGRLFEAGAGDFLVVNFLIMRARVLLRIGGILSRVSGWRQEDEMSCLRMGVRRSLSSLPDERPS